MNTIQNDLIEALKTQTPDNETPVDILIDLFSISKEAAYRRLRGEITLTLDEAITLAQKLKISLDNLIEKNYEDRSAFHIIPHANNSIKDYLDTLNGVLNAYKFVKSDPDSIQYLVNKVFSPIFYYKYDGLTKLALSKWMHLFQNNIRHQSLSGIIMSSQLEQFRISFREVAMQIPTVFIFTDALFLSPINEVLYRFKINLLTKQDVEILKQEMLSLLDDLENIVITGCYENGAKVNIYMADIHLDISYDYLRGNGLEACGIGVYMLNFLSSLNHEICNNQRIWIESMMKYSTLLTQCEETQRTAFFTRLRNRVQELNV